MKIRSLGIEKQNKTKIIITVNNSIFPSFYDIIIIGIIIICTIILFIYEDFNLFIFFFVKFNIVFSIGLGYRNIDIER